MPLIPLSVRRRVRRAIERAARRRCPDPHYIQLDMSKTRASSPVIVDLAGQRLPLDTGFFGARPMRWDNPTAGGWSVVFDMAVSEGWLPTVFDGAGGRVELPRGDAIAWARYLIDRAHRMGTFVMDEADYPDGARFLAWRARQDDPNEQRIVFGRF